MSTRPALLPWDWETLGVPDWDSVWPPSRANTYTHIHTPSLTCAHICGTVHTVRYSAPQHRCTKGPKLSQAATHSSPVDTFALNSASSRHGPPVQHRGRLCGNVLSRWSKCGSVGSPNNPAHCCLWQVVRPRWACGLLPKGLPVPRPEHLRACVPGTSLEDNPSEGHGVGHVALVPCRPDRGRRALASAKGPWPAECRPPHGIKTHPSGRRRGGAAGASAVSNGSLRTPKRPSAQGKQIYALHKMVRGYYCAWRRVRKKA